MSTSIQDVQVNEDHSPKLDPSGLKLLAHSATITKDEHNDRQFTFTFSSETPDRDKDVVSQSGIDLKAFKANPVVLWAHNIGFDTPPPPVARVPHMWFRDGSLMGTVEFPARGVSSFSDTLHDLVDAGFLKAVSIGFRPKEISFDEERGGFNFIKTELVELSLVPVGMHPEALIEMKAKGIDVTPLAEWIDQAKGMLSSDSSDVTDSEPVIVEPEPVAREPVARELDMSFMVPASPTADEIRSVVREELAQFKKELPPPSSYVPTAPIPVPEPVPVVSTPTPTRKSGLSLTEDEGLLLKGVIKAALRDAAAQRVRDLTGRLED